MKLITIIAALLAAVFIGCTKDKSQSVLQKISLSPDTLIMKSGNSMQLSPVFTPAVFSVIAVDWTSTNSSVVSVTSSGLISAQSAGTALVTVKDKNSSTAGKVFVISQ